MSRSFKSLVIALSSAGLLASWAGDVQACHPRSRGGYGGGSARVIVVRAPQQAYQQQPYCQPGVVQGATGQVGVQFQGQQFQGQQVPGQQFQGQPIQGQTTGASATAISALGGGVSGAGQSAVQSQGQVQGQTQFQGQAQFQGQSQFASNPQTGFAQQGQAGGQFAGTGTAGGATAQSQVQTQQFQSQPQTQQSQPQVQQQAQQVQAQPQVQAQAQSQTSQQNAQTLALEALSGLDSSEPVQTATQAASQSAQPGMTGNFSASLQSLGATVRLTLNADNSFSWVVTTKDGKSSTFQGSFAVSGNKLTLARTDNTKMEASLTPTTTGFSLKMIGQNASALSFVRV